MKKFFSILFTLFACALSAQNHDHDGYFFREGIENLSKDNFILALEGKKDSVFVAGVTREKILNEFVRIWNEKFLAGDRKLATDEDGRTNVIYRLKETRSTTLPDGTEITESYWSNAEGIIKQKKRGALPEEKFLISQKGRVLASLRCGNPVFCEKLFPGTEEPIIPPPTPNQPEIRYVDRVIHDTVYLGGQPNQQITQFPNQVIQPQILQVNWPMNNLPLCNFCGSSHVGVCSALAGGVWNTGYVGGYNTLVTNSYLGPPYCGMCGSYHTGACASPAIGIGIGFGLGTKSGCNNNLAYPYPNRH
ncbi:hypothetical protein A2645_00415 [Candidatus Nomurabacteria bacterium RIFCSPHIGHO2_01_FULL_39_9]|uniref:Uncharacterized protein n=1 Tax=Candidatus Nomurabacteria bacterium RIFCSPHIGHO2_01_FULL_39_9 TaxID=1801735 RepID=A0A1F6UVY4_9BACT|nr:MAG: hypothetical protein A2645_00415 [Candidatus Nomurabacteria bacterium RIFCSPHIGHO2_01_FULL_39_9]